MKFERKKLDCLDKPGQVYVKQELVDDSGASLGMCILADSDGVWFTHQTPGIAPPKFTNPSDFEKLAEAIGTAGVDFVGLRRSNRNKILGTGV